ncbi:MAG: twin-arginine translocase TatA/TatE family subunit [Chloroflexi bacterium]|nr:twin-arginine translocase TatA/TatE family subunit [Chloroflexota bacterium]
MGLPNIGPLELIIILVIALLILGPGKLPEVGAAFGKTIREFKKASTDIQEATNVTPATAPAAPVAAAPAAVPPAPNTLSQAVAPNTLSEEDAPKGTPTDAVEERA